MIVGRGQSTLFLFRAVIMSAVLPTSPYVACSTFFFSYGMVWILIWIGSAAHTRE